MPVVIFAPSQFPVEDLAAALRREEVEVAVVRFDAGISAQEIPAGITSAVLLQTERGVITIGDRASQLRALLPPESRLLLCVPQPHDSDRKILLKCGATEVITPRGWSGHLAAERILAELIAGGSVQPSASGRMVGATRRMQEIYCELQKIAPYDDPVLILGETGTGKELIAAEIHRLSGRESPLQPINCPELTPELFGSELFGHEKGAFTNAIGARKGMIADAGDGSVFLDEIGDLDLSGQAKLLRVIEDRTVRPIGANRAEPIRARLIFATNRDLQQACIEGKFRRDLFERLRQSIIELPPLRERRADLPLLFRRFLDEFNREYDKSCRLPPSGLDCLFRYEWPGNVRELRNVARRSAKFADDSGAVSAAVLHASLQEQDSLRPSHSVVFDPTRDQWRDVVDRVQQQYFRAVLAETQGNKEAAAKLTGLSRSQFYEKLKEIRSG
jgi:two-component system, NtrC family, response regulator HydG